MINNYLVLIKRFVFLATGLVEIYNSLTVEKRHLVQNEQLGLFHWLCIEKQNKQHVHTLQDIINYLKIFGKRKKCFKWWQW